MKYKRIFLLVSAVIALVDSVFVAANYYLSEASFTEDLREESETLYSAFQASIKDAETNLLVVASVFANDQHVRSQFLAGKKALESEGGDKGGSQVAKARQALYDTVAPSWKMAMEKLGARQLHFHLGPGSLSFLRVHKPGSYGDRMDDVRFTIVDTNRERQARTGFETGRVYSGIRAVWPVTAWDKEKGAMVHVGALEAGKSFDTIVDSFKKTTGTDVTVLLTRHHVQSVVWPRFIKSHYEQHAVGGHHFLEATSSPFTPILGQLQYCDDQEGYRIPPYTVLENGRYLFVNHFPLRDYLGMLDASRPLVGHVVLWKDATDRVLALQRNQRFNIVYGIAAYLLIEMLLLFGFRRATVHLQRQVEDQTRELKNQSDALRTLSEERDIILSNTRDFIYRYDADSDFIYVSNGVERVSGYSVEEWKNDYRSILTDSHLNARARYYTYKALLEGEPQPRYLVEIRHKNDGLVLLEMEERPFFDNGVIAGVIGAARDVTEQRRMQHALEVSEARYRSIFQNASAGVVTAGPDGRLTAVNQAFCRLLDYSEEELLEMNIEQITHPDDWEENRVKFGQALNGKLDSYQLVKRYLRRDGSRLWCLTSAAWISDSYTGSKYAVALIQDISPQKQAERALRDKEEQLRSLINATPDIICFKDGDGRWLEANRAELELFGLDGIDYHGKTDVELAESAAPIHRVAFFNCRESDENTWSSGEMSRAEESIPLADGGEKIFDVIKVPVFRSDGSRRALVILGRDITERKSSEDALEQTLREWRYAMDSFEDAIYLLTPERKLIRANQAFYTFTGAVPAEALGRHIADLVHPEGENEACQVCRVQEAYRDDLITMEADDPNNPAGKPIEVTVKVLRDRDGEVTGILTGIHDLTNARKVEAALRESEERYRQIVETAQEGIWVLNKQGLTSFVNHRMAGMLGYQVDEFSNLTFRQIVAEAPWAVGGHFMQEAEGSFEVSLQHKDGAHVWTRCTTNPLMDDAGQLVGFLGMFNDITDRKRNEQRIMQLLDENRDLIKRNIEIQEEERRHLARELHDEMGQQVTAMRLDAAMIKQACELEQSSVQEYAMDIEKIAVNLLQTMRSVTNRLRPANLDYLGLVDTLRDTLQAWQGHNKDIKAGMTCVGELDGLTENINIAIYRIFQECLTNITKHAEATKVEISLVRKGFGLPSDCIELEVVDNGKGLYTDKSATGMGLVGIRERVKMLRGDFSAVSDNDRGTRIQVVIPCVEQG